MGYRQKMTDCPGFYQNSGESAVVPLVPEKWPLSIANYGQELAAFWGKYGIQEETANGAVGLAKWHNQFFRRQMDFARSPRNFGKNHGQSVIFRRGHILDSNRDLNFPIFCIISGILLVFRFYPKFGQFFTRNQLQNGAVWGNMDRPGPPRNFFGGSWAICHFLTRRISNSNLDLKCHISSPFLSPSEGPILPEIWPIPSRNQLSGMVIFGDKWITRDSPGILVKSRPIFHVPTRPHFEL